VSPGELDRRLVRLGARIAKERLVRAGVLAQPIRQLSLLRRVIQVANVMDPTHLIAYGLGQFRIVMTEGAGGDAGHEVEVHLARIVGEGATGSGNEGDGIPTVGLLNASVK
jgi:hypothetical protein